MQVIMFDRQSIFIHGMKISLQQHIPGISIQSVGQAEELWQKIESAPDALVMPDSGLDAEFCREVLQRTAQQFPEVKIIITAMDGSQKWLHEVMQFNVQAVVPRDSDAETFVLALNAVARGMMFLPGDWLNSTELESRDIKALSARQREILQMLAAGESNKQIGRALNISTGTVKAHLESLYRRLDVKNRTQAAMMLNESN
ncbi:response regulator transcription factor [Salmonella enterica subsp. enterica serovar Typhimurium]|uniref:helix-turn-helix transcriptional regulator n=1 Tax=Salmonella enterica TaxID=28901 RepID=UPI0020A267D2|nr:response regulator transcription factor [Salmonella enterica]MCP2900926.1 response regulator transcription factor [Salmonella enterica subsp. enterica serovar Typhimurium]MCP2910089.1 response regulator transcription factor [Salmonella enterica subsp. enterica serovar Typhimurium]MCP2914634.1 response regulator transcription factor [Salmonella enterica subsp. enterica serovar Typhimurium]MCP2928886.1 response regulator transcription factor [Salmonella enterica subsp. enterica serovar Typhimu